MTLHYRQIPTPLGPMRAVTDGTALVELEFDRPDPRSADDDPRALRILDATAAWLDQYFAGGDAPYAHPLVPVGTRFQQDVWRALLSIPYGNVATYADIARHVGRPSAVRAVGAANGRNPIAILIPCHRVIGSDGTLTGYAGGLERKQALLALEQRQAFALVA